MVVKKISRSVLNLGRSLLGFHRSFSSRLKIDTKQNFVDRFDSAKRCLAARGLLAMLTMWACIK